MSLPKFGIILAIFGLVLMVAAIATIGALLPTTFYAGPQNQHSILSETLGVAFLVVFRVGPGDRIEGFATEGEAGRWIKNEAPAWLHSRRHNSN